MLLTTIFKPGGQMGPFLAALWQGDTPPGIVVQRWIYLGVPTEKMMLVWEAADDDEREWLESRLRPFGEIDSWVCSDSTPGMAAAMGRDLDGFGEWMRQRGTPEAAIATQLDVRRRGMEASTFDDAVAAGEAWAKEQAGG
jgi:hypothetical protein